MRRLHYCMGCGERMTVTFYFCPNCLKEYTVTGTIAKPDWMKFMENDYRSFERKKATTHEVPMTFFCDSDEYLLIMGENNYSLRPVEDLVVDFMVTGLHYWEREFLSSEVKV